MNNNPCSPGFRIYQFLQRLTLMNVNEISPYVRYAADSILCAPFQIGPRVIFDYELVLIESGKFLLEYEGIEYTCQKGDVLLFRPGHTHTMKSIGNFSISQPHIHFDMSYDTNSEKIYISFKDLPDFTDEERLLIRPDFFSGINIGPILSVSCIDTFKQLLFDVIALYSTQPAFYTLLMKDKLLLLLHHVLNDNTHVGEDVPQAEQNLPQIIREFIDYHFCNVISLNSLEKQFHYSKFYISRGFAQHTGISVIQYYNQKRLEYAKNQIRKGKSVTEIAKELHFSSIYTFSRFFKTHEGCSPTDFKKRLSSE